MRIAYLDCFAGISGDMFLGALIDAGVPAQVLHDATAALQLGASLKIEVVDRSGISATKVHVLEAGALAEEAGSSMAHSQTSGGAGSRPHSRGAEVHSPSSQTAPQALEQQTLPTSTLHEFQPKTQHMHRGGHDHPAPDLTEAEVSSSQTHHDQQNPPHAHGRSLSVIREIIQHAPLATPVKQTALHAFELLGQAEAKIHNVPVEEIHFHEVGAVDAIVDIVAASAGIAHLGVDAWYCSPLNVGGGMVVCAHGTFPVPAPATADLLRGFPTYSAHIQKELVTPTGSALLRALDPSFGPQPAMRVEEIGYGAGTRNPRDFPNVLRLSVGETFESATVSLPPSATPHRPAADPVLQAQDSPKQVHPHDSQTVTVLETALDDLSPQILAYVTEKALAEGALDVMLTPVIMKKGRPGTLLTVLCNPRDGKRMEDLILRETSTLGVRIREDRRSCLDRSHVPVLTLYGEIRMKIGSHASEEMNAAPEYEDCRAAAVEHNLPLKQVQQAAIAAYRR